MVIKEIGDIQQNIYEETQVEWKITNFFSDIEDKENYYKSPAFPFKDNTWYFQLQPQSVTKLGFIFLFIAKERDCEYSVDYNIGLKKLDGNVEQLTAGTFQSSDTSSGPKVINLPALRKREHELVPSNVLTIMCSLKSGTPHLSQPEVLNESKLEKLIEKKLLKHDTLSENFKDLLTDKETCDTTLCVMDKEYTAHKTVLMARSSVFKAMFHHDTKERQTGIITIPDCDPVTFKEFLEYLYSGELNLSSFNCGLHLYETSDKYDVQELKAFCTQYAMENLTVENLCDVVILADKYDDGDLFSAAQEFFNANLNKMFQASEWDSLMKNHYRLASKLLKAVPKGQIVK